MHPDHPHHADDPLARHAAERDRALGARPLVVQAEELDEEAAAWLAQRCQLVRCGATEPDFAALLSRAAGLIVRTYTRVDAALLDGAPALRVVARAGVGLDNIDVPACRARGIAVVNTPDANTRAVVELVVAFMLDALRPREYLSAPLPLDAWRARRVSLTARKQLCQCTLGIVGLGRVGRGLARAAAGLGMAVLYHDLQDIPAEQRSGATPCGSLDELLPRCDVVSLHVDHRPSNRHLINEAALGLLRDDALLINTSRGFVVDPHALAAFCRAHPRAMAVLDVHDPEPIPEGAPLLGVANVRLSPHIGAATSLAHKNMSWVVRDLWHAIAPGEP